MKKVYLYVMIAILPGMQGCSPELGSEAWCEKMADTPGAEWTPKESTNFLNSCDRTLLIGK